jgi:hypothetical protein
MLRSFGSALAGILFISGANAFHVPVPLVAKQASSLLVANGAVSVVADSLWHGVLSITTTHSVSAVPAWKVFALEANNFWIADGGAWDIARNVGLGLTAVIFLLAGLTFLYASYIIPVAAQELEKECKELNPQLWEEYQAKLGEGETLATRPDLMQEMGAKLQPLLEAKIRAMDAAQGKSGSSMPTALETTLNPIKSAAIEVEPENGETRGPTITITSADQWDESTQKKA